MLTCTAVIAGNDANINTVVELTWDQRKRSRYKAKTQCGQDIGWMLERGKTLADNDCLLAEDGTKVRVLAAMENVSVVHSQDPWLLARAAYHLGNRHMPLQVGQGWLRYQYDYVLDDMVRGFGFEVEQAQQPFEPENGAYGEHGGHHHHEH